MPDSEKALNMMISSTFDPKGAKAAQAGIGQTERAFKDMARTMTGAKVAEHIEGSLKPLGTLKSASLGMLALTQRLGPDLVKNAKALGGIADELRTVDQATKQLQAQYKEGLISGSNFKVALGGLRTIRKELRGMTADDYKAATARREAMVDSIEATKRADARLLQHGTTVKDMTNLLEDYDQGIGKLMKSWNIGYAEASRFADDFTKKLALQQEYTAESARAQKEIASGTGFLGALGTFAENVGKDLIGAGKGFAGVIMQVPRRLSEGVKDGLSNAFSSRPITRALTEIPILIFRLPSGIRS